MTKTETKTKSKTKMKKSIERIFNHLLFSAAAAGANRALIVLVCLVFSHLVAIQNANAEVSDDGHVIQVKSVVEVDGTKAEIVLGDLIVKHNLNTAVIEAIKNIRLADTPKAGESRSFTAMGLDQVFRQQLRDYENQKGVKISLRIPARVTVVRKSFRLGVEEIQIELKNQLKEFCNECTFDITGIALPILPTTVSQGSTWSIKLRHEMPKGNFSLPLEVTNDDGSKRSYWITGSVAIQKKVPVAARSLQIGEKVSPQDFVLQLKDITFSSDVAATEIEIISSIAARQISAGQIVWRSSLRREMAVKNGDAVKVVAGKEGWQIMIDGVAQGSAYIGDTINVKIPRTQKLISGLLTEKGVVEVR